MPPAAGWSSALLLTVLLASAGTILDLPMLAETGPDGRSQTAFLVQLLPAMGLLALALSFLGLRDAVAHVAGSVVGGLLVLVGAAGALSDAPDLGTRLGVLQASAARLFQQVFVEGTRTDETSGFLLAVGIVGAATGWFGGWNLFRRGFIAPALVSVVALVVVTCLSPLVDVSELYVPLVILTATALLLALRTGLAGRQRAWARLGFLDPTAGTPLLLAGGALLGIGALVLASAAAARITAAPLAPAWSSIDRVPEILDEIDRIFGELGNRSLQGSGSFGDSAEIQSTWESSSAIVFSAESSDGRGYYWRGAAYDRFDGSRWTATAGDRRAVPAGDDLVAGTADGEPLLGARRTVRFIVTAGSLGGDTLLAPVVARSADRDAVAIADADGGPVAELELERRLRKGDSYGLSVEIANEGGAGLTQAKLAAAGVAYPAWALRYTRLEPGTLSERAAGAAAAIVAELPAGRRDPFHVAQAMERWFARAGDFRYAIDVAGVCAPGEGTVDCLLRSRVGFCQHYATAMTLMLRSRSIPARYVQGYLPGRRLGDGAWAVEASAAHAWVEVWFPGWGWVRFDPTPGGNSANGQEGSNLPEGRPIPTPPPDPAEPEPTPVF
ncbi:MAG: transglutaminaseTgpA domain-containing protein, partial [Chloroflexota bacterium]